jgi:hypothetical protein
MIHSPRTIVIGDLHGCYDESIELLDRLAVTATDCVIFAGDLVDRGPKRRECLDLAMRHRCIFGNHEEKHLRMRQRPESAPIPDHLETRRVLENADYDYLESLPLYIRIPEANAVVVHAGVLPGRPIEEQPASILLHGQCIRPPAISSQWPSKAPAYGKFWTD